MSCRAFESDSIDDPGDLGFNSLLRQSLATIQVRPPANSSAGNFIAEPKRLIQRDPSAPARRKRFFV